VRVHELDGLTLLLGGAVEGLTLLLGGVVDVSSSSSSSRSSSIKISVGKSFCFLLPTVAVSRDDEMFDCKSEYSPKHDAPADGPSVNASDFLSWGI
jgi:hypothetical protein